MTQAGLSSAEANQRLKQYGPNALPEQPPTPLWRRGIRQFSSPLIYILLFALAVDMTIWVIEGASGLPLESLAISLILLVNAALGMYQENKAEVALTHLKSLVTPLVWVLRDGHLEHLPSTQLVPGDLVRLEAGDRVPADGVIRTTHGLLVDESVLTGESLPVEKSEGAELFSGTLVARGSAYAEVTRTGPASAMGRLAVLLGDITQERTPLERRLTAFGNLVARAILVLAILLVVGGLAIEGIDRIGHVLLFAVALAVAAVPEGLPAVLTLTLALGVERMSKRQVVVRRLSAVEALGSVTVIATDKTGTLTENRMHVSAIDATDPQRAIVAMVLANDAEETTRTGDPLELALLDYAVSQGYDPEALRRAHPRRSSLPFDSINKYMRVTVDAGATRVSYLKGAPEVLLARSRMDEGERQSWRIRADAAAADGQRLLGLAHRAGEGDTDLEFLGLVLLWDPPRPEAPAAVAQALKAGVRVVMITGDHPGTAQAVAGRVGIPGTRVLTGPELDTLSQQELNQAVQEITLFSRVSPEHKLRLVEALQAQGEIVAVTGDGVNDAPALKRADVGVAMGQRGSDVAREVADLVLLDDNFASIVAAIEEGRSIYENIQKFIRFLFSTNLALVLLVVFGAFGSYLLGLYDAAGGLLLPLTAAQLLWINIIADGPPALALALDQNPDVMRQPPRDPKAKLLDAVSLRFIVLTGTVKAAAGLALLDLLPRTGSSHMVTRSAVFLYESISQLLFAYPARSISSMPRRNNALRLTVLLSIGLQFLVVHLPPMRRLLGLEPLPLGVLAAVIAAALLTWLKRLAK
ncbi:MAG: HAD family hydrolase [Chloroflexi bacterium]|nr:MAG: HAD family hydrolase [Chloroflexota bacterium]